MDHTATIMVDDLHVRYGDVVAVAGVSLTVADGEVFGILGPNGAGKSTLLACIEGLQHPSSGSVRVAGHDVAQEPTLVKGLLGVQLQRAALFDELTALELVEFYAALYGYFPSRAVRLGLLERFGLAQKARARPGQLSGGQQQRLSLALALVNDPRVLLLDEPTTALDPQARRGVWALIRRLQAEGRTIVLTTHSMDEAEQLCGRLAIIDGGRLVALGSPTDLIARYAPPTQPGERQPNLEDVFLALTGHTIDDGSERFETPAYVLA